MRKECALIGAALDIGQKHTGTEVAASWLRLKGLVEAVNRRFFRVEDLGDLTTTQDISYASENPSVETKLSELAQYARRLGATVRQKLDEDKFVLTVGGDHSLAAGTLAGTLAHDPEAKIIWVDAHADLNTPQTSPSGNTHGMPVALAMQLIDDHQAKKMFEFLPRLKPENIVYIGLRDVDPGEQAFIDRLGIKAYTAQDVLSKGVHRVLDETLNYLDPWGMSQFHISFDVDGIDPQFFPSTGTPVSGGLDLFQGAQVIRTVAETGRLLALDLVEINPTLGSREDVERTCLSTFSLLEAIPNWSDTLIPVEEKNLWPEYQEEVRPSVS